MRDSICTIPVTEVFEKGDGCPLCEMRSTIESRIIEYILGDAMMEPDIRIETNRVGFCTAHFEKMLSARGRLQLAIMLESHIDEVKKNIFDKKFFVSNTKKAEKVKRLSDSCFICDKIEWGFSRMIETIYKTYETSGDFRKMFNERKVYCMPHYEMLLGGIDKKKMRSYGGEMAINLNRITLDYVSELCTDVKKYCTMYDYRNNTENKDWGTSKDAVERTVSFLSGKNFQG